ncbi:MAG: DUF4838 domain-containing protein [Verrucomicrobia bacterium]|nr:DUF4838 domain-containing protein [Verrucomicrobiota bacterium]
MNHARLSALFLLLGWLLATSLNSFAKPAALKLAENGRALQPIVISDKASGAMRTNALELAEYLGRITGAKFEVTTGDGARGIVLGTLAEFPNPSLAQPLEIRNTFDGKEAFAIRTEKNRVLLVGATDLGASHAAMRLLEHLGCRWFFPAKEWEVVPTTKTLSVSFEETDRPKILARRIWYGYGAFNDKGHPQGGSVLKDYEAWTRHNRMASSFRVSAGHAWQTIILANKKVVDEHPEYRALVKGERKGEQLCVSNPEVQRLATEWALAYLTKNPDREMVSMECSDGLGQCECDNCKKLGSVSDRVFSLANHVARAVREKFPGKLVGCLAYAEHSEPPSFALEPNVYVQLTAGFTQGRYTFDELVDLWPKQAKAMGFYEYFSVWLWDFDRLPGGNGGNLTHIRSRIDRYVKAGAASFDAESGNNWGVHGRGYYIANKLLWNPDANVDALLADFYEKAFGPGAAAMKRYYERVAVDNKPLLSRGLVGEAFRDVGEAARLAKDRPDVLARLDQLKHYLRYVHLRWQLDHEKDKAKQKELTVAALTLGYRTRYEYMNHWAAMRYTFAGDAAKKFDEPTWKPTDRSTKPWLVDAPVTRDETEQWFRAGLEYFQPTPVKELKFSSDLVPVTFTNAKPIVSLQSYQRPMNYALHSRAGEPIEAEFTTGVIAWYRDRAAARWWLRDGASNVVASGTLPQDGEAHKLVMKVPRAGTYFFEGNDSAAGWKFKVEPDRAVTLLNERGHRVISLGQMQEMFFYVPKGTRELQYFWNGGPHKLLGPDKKLIAEVNQDDEVVTIPVPIGKDGQVWSLSPRAHSQLWFFNAPNCLAASPAALLLPKELVRRDQLNSTTHQ